ncbi:hypothetical protein BCF74_1247 [Knoellia remsis]|uniref:LTD domain-containing protein n=1 Tax=Knoellia remsis TaxID=407159 RepID=A0A2T0U9T3_9MICO|nr:ExeM/NucH family extracellular endonuclease [Knoellia remsis]PRY54676.1 hypothetical protein BCF74_1247 [Knoellia remsis]
MSAFPRFARRRCAAIAAPLLALPLAGATALIGAAPAGAVSTTVLISEVYGGGGNSGAPFQNDFIELGNRAGTAIDLSGWRVQYFSASGGSGGSTTLSGSIPAGKTFLIKQAAGAGAGQPLPTPDATGTLNMSATNGRVDLYDPAGTLVDRIGFGSANAYETKAAPALSNTTSAARSATFADTDDNSVDFTVGAPTPTPSGGTGGPGPEPEPTEVTIAQIQGTGATSPLNGQQVTTSGVVTANYPTGGFNGFYLQTAGTGGTTDATPGASDGVFVFGTTDVAIGDCYTVTATVTEYNGLTELTRPTLTPKSGCAPVTPTPLPTLPVTDADKEQYEGMLVLPQGTYTITNNYALNQYGQLGLAVGDQPLYQATEKVAPGAAAAAYEAENRKKYITLDDGSSWDYLRNATAQDSPLPYLSQAEPMRTGSQLTFAKPVILDYRFQWNYQPTGQVVGPTDSDDPVVTENDREATPPATGGDTNIAFINVLNYFTDLGEDEDQVKNCPSYDDRDGNPVTTNYCEVRGAWTEKALADQRAKLVSAVNGLDAAVVGLSEIENSAGLSWVNRDRDYTLREFVAALNAAGGTWAYAESPVVNAPNEDVIRTAFIYNPQLVKPKGSSQLLLDPAFANARYPLAQEWQAQRSGTKFVTVVNHFKSKGSGEDDGTGQGLSNPSREAQARALTSWTASQWAKDPVFLIGDFNAYSKETPIQIIESAGYTELVKKYEPGSASYQFSGRLGSLDHMFGNAAAAELVTGAGIWDINADESVAMQYSRRNYNVTDFYTTQPYAASDHDPVLVGIDVKGGWWDRKR